MPLHTTVSIWRLKRPCDCRHLLSFIPFLREGLIWNVNLPTRNTLPTSFPSVRSLPSPFRIEWFIEEKAFSLSYDLAPIPLLPLSHPLPLFPKQIVSLSQSSCVSPVELTYGWVGFGDGGGSKSHDSEKAWSSIINHLILSDCKRPHIENVKIPSWVLYTYTAGDK